MELAAAIQAQALVPREQRGIGQRGGGIQRLRAGMPARGGMAEVYRARKATDARLYAIKCMRPALAKEARFVDMFVREGRLAVRFELSSASNASGEAFRFSGLPVGVLPAGRWLEPAVQAQIVGARAVVLGPEPMIGAQRIVLRLDAQRLVLATDGLGPFVVAGDEAAP